MLATSIGTKSYKVSFWLRSTLATSWLTFPAVCLPRSMEASTRSSLACASLRSSRWSLRFVWRLVELGPWSHFVFWLDWARALSFRRAPHCWPRGHHSRIVVRLERWRIPEHRSVRSLDRWCPVICWTRTMAGDLFSISLDFLASSGLFSS